MKLRNKVRLENLRMGFSLNHPHTASSNFDSVNNYHKSLNTSDGLINSRRKHLHHKRRNLFYNKYTQLEHRHDDPLIEEGPTNDLMGGMEMAGKNCVIPETKVDYI